MRGRGGCRAVSMLVAEGRQDTDNKPVGEGAMEAQHRWEGGICDGLACG